MDSLRRLRRILHICRTGVTSTAHRFRKALVLLPRVGVPNYRKSVVTRLNRANGKHDVCADDTNFPRQRQWCAVHAHGGWRLIAGQAH